MMADEKIKNSSELEFVVFCIENVAAKLGMDAERVYQAFAEKSDILSGYIVPEYEVLHTQSREWKARCKQGTSRLGKSGRQWEAVMRSEIQVAKSVSHASRKAAIVYTVPVP